MKLMYITNNPQIALIAQNAGVDRIFIDMEYIGKDLRQGGMDTVQNHHTLEDITAIRKVLTKSELLVRVNPIHDSSDVFSSSEEEIEAVIKAKADIIMLPYFKTACEVKRFLKAVNGRCKTLLLFETAESVENIDEILKLDGIDEVFIGLNDLSLSYGYKFLFEPLANGTVEKIANKFKDKNFSFGFGGIARLGEGTLSSEKIIAEHYRLGSTCVILSRSFCNANYVTDEKVIGELFENEVKRIRDYEQFCSSQTEEFFNKNKADVKASVEIICK